MPQIGPTEGKGSKAVLRQTADGFPHDEIVWTDGVVQAVGSAEFENGPVPEGEKNRPGDGLSLVIGQRHKPLPGGDQVLLQVTKERKGLRRHSMPFAGQAMEPVVALDGFQVAGEADSDFFVLSIPDVAPGGFAQALKEPIRTGGEIEEVVGVTSQSAGRGARSARHRA